MKEQDKLRSYFRELPREEPSENFTFMVMERVKMERVRTNAVYHPIISRQMWLRLLCGVILIFIGALVFRVYFPGNEQVGLLRPIFQFDYSLILKPLQVVSASLMKMPFSFVIALVAISLLLLVDQLYSRFVSR